jgi:hypothetical protein
MDSCQVCSEGDDSRRLPLAMCWFLTGLAILQRSSFDLDNRMRSFAGRSGAKKRDNTCTGTLVFFTNNSSFLQNTLLQIFLELACRAESGLAQGPGYCLQASKWNPCVGTGSEIELAAELYHASRERAGDLSKGGGTDVIHGRIIPVRPVEGVKRIRLELHAHTLPEGQRKRLAQR